MNHGTGAVRDTYDHRDYQWSEIAMGSAPYDWSKVYNIEDKVGILKPKDQDGSSSCGGQAWGEYIAALEAIITGTFEECSAKFIYNQTHAPGGGSAGRPNCDLCVKTGVCLESLCPSYDNGNPAGEAFYLKNDITPEAFANAQKNKTISYAIVDANIDSVAQAIESNNGCILGITGQNNGTWLTPFPKPPTTTLGGWNHWVYAGRVMKIGGKKYIGFLNSWGDVGDRGWQWVGEDYFNALNGGAIWSCWTMIYKPQTDYQQHTFTKFLRFGMIDSEVKFLQEALKRDGCFPNIPTTNYFGKITLASVKKFQVKHQLVADGLAGKNTNTKLSQVS